MNRGVVAVIRLKRYGAERVRRDALTDIRRLRVTDLHAMLVVKRRHERIDIGHGRAVERVLHGL